MTRSSPEGEGCRFVSTEALAGFLGALGFGGAIALDATGSTSPAVAIGLVLGVVLGAVAEGVEVPPRHR